MKLPLALRLFAFSVLAGSAIACGAPAESGENAENGESNSAEAAGGEHAAVEHAGKVDQEQSIIIPTCLPGQTCHCNLPGENVFGLAPCAPPKVIILPPGVH